VVDVVDDDELMAHPAAAAITATGMAARINVMGLSGVRAAGRWRARATEQSLLTSPAQAASPGASGNWGQIRITAVISRLRQNDVIRV